MDIKDLQRKIRLFSYLTIFYFIISILFLYIINSSLAISYSIILIVTIIFGRYNCSYCPFYKNGCNNKFFVFSKKESEKEVPRLFKYINLLLAIFLIFVPGITIFYMGITGKLTDIHLIFMVIMVILLVFTSIVRSTIKNEYGEIKFCLIYHRLEMSREIPEEISFKNYDKESQVNEDEINHHSTRNASNKYETKFYSPCGTIIHASLIDRFLAFLLDGIILFVVSICILTLSTVILSDFSGVNLDLTLKTSIFFNILILFGYFVVLEGPLNQGQTLGKMAASIKVVNQSDQKTITYKQSIIRNVLFFVDMIPYILPGLLGALKIKSSNKSQRIGDSIAKTVVIMKKVKK